MILFTGAAGYIGSHTVLNFLDKGFTDIVIFDNLETGHIETIQTLQNICGNVKFEKGDLRNISDIEQVFQKYKINFVIHFAAFAFVEESMKNLIGDYVVVSVEDEGIGIAENEYSHAFDKFAQIENSLYRKAGGTGLGLPIAKQLLEAHNGAIWCDSIINKGSNFHFAIPVETIPARQKEALSIS